MSSLRNAALILPLDKEVAPSVFPVQAKGGEPNHGGHLTPADSVDSSYVIVMISIDLPPVIVYPDSVTITTLDAAPRDGIEVIRHGSGCESNGRRKAAKTHRAESFTR